MARHGSMNIYRLIPQTLPCDDQYQWAVPEIIDRFYSEASQGGGNTMRMHICYFIQVEAIVLEQIRALQKWLLN